MMRKMLGLAVLFTLLLSGLYLIPHYTEGAGDSFSSSILVNWNSTGSHQRRPVILTRGMDDLFVIYQDYFYTNWDISMARSTDCGYTWSEKIQVDDSRRDLNSSNDFSNQMYPTAVFAPNGTLYVAYSDDQEIYIGVHYYHVYVVWSEDYVNFSTHRRVDTSIRDAIYPSLAVGEDGTLYLTWLDKREGGKFHVYFARSEDGGVTWIGEKRVNSGGLSVDQYGPRIAVYGEKVFIVWSDQREGDFSIFMAVSYDRGDTFLPERRVNDDLEPYSQNDPDLAVDSTGLVYIVWSDNRLGSYDIYYSTTRDGRNFTMNMLAYNGPEGGLELNPRVAVFSPGMVGITWVDRSHDEGDIYFTYTINNGTTWTGARRVDDTQRTLGTADDETKQEDPHLAFNSIGRPLVVWADHRDELFTRSDIYFARYSETLTGQNRPPIFKDRGFTPEIGTNETEFTFTLWYRDIDGDDPSAGYPRLLLFADKNGTEQIGGATVMRPAESERDNTAGSLWIATTTVEWRSGRIYYRYEVMSGDMTEPLTSPVYPGPILDLSKPIVLDYGPIIPRWYNTSYVRCYLMIKDIGVAGVAPGSIRAYIKTLGSDIYTGVGDLPHVSVLPNGSVYAYLDVKANEGKYNWVKWRFTDRVGNLNESPPVNIWIDTIKVKFRNLQPSPYETQIFPDINVSIIVYDRDLYQPDLEVSGVNISSIEYCYSHSEVLPYTPWKKVENYTVEEHGDVTIWFHFRLTEGNLNMIKFRAKDLADTGWYVYGPVRYTLRIPDNYPPVLTGRIYPSTTASRTPHIWWDPAEDIENDTITYRVRILEATFGTTVMDWVSTGRYNFIDVSASVNLRVGKYFVEVVANDSHSNSNVLKANLTVLSSGDLPPPAPGPLLKSLFAYTAPGISWGGSVDPEGEAVSYLVQVGRDWASGDIVPWKWCKSPNLNFTEPLTYGIYHVEILAWDGGNFSSLKRDIFKVIDFGINFTGPRRWSLERGDALVVEVSITNEAHLSDNVTVYLEGEGAGEKWIKLELYYKDYSLTLPPGAVYPLRVAFTPEKDTKARVYSFRLRVVCEDGQTSYTSPEYSVEVLVKPRSKYPALTYLREKVFGEYLPLTIVAMVVITVAGALIYNMRLKKRMVEDPFAEQRKLYKELYGVEPDVETLKKMVEGEAAAPLAVTTQETMPSPVEPAAVEVKEEDLKEFMRGAGEGIPEEEEKLSEIEEAPEEEYPEEEEAPSVPPPEVEEISFKKPGEERTPRRRRRYVVWDEDDEL